MKKKVADCLMTTVYYVNRTLPGRPRVIEDMFCKPPNERLFFHYSLPDIRLSIDGTWFVSHTDATVNDLTDAEIASLDVYDTFEEAAKEAGWI